MKDKKLHNIKATGFTSPKGYFDGMEDRFMRQLIRLDQLQDINDPGFEVPQDYFEAVESDILAKISNDKTSVVQLFGRKQVYYIAGIAASILLTLAIFLNKSEENTISVEMVESYFQDSDLDSYELAELLSEADLLEDDFSITEPDFNEENLESYLLENTDIESLLE